MLLMIVRHGEAESKSAGKLDEDRKLTEEGSLRLRNNLLLAKEIAGGKIDLILSSPITRAMESSKIASEVFEQKFEVDDLLEPESSPYEVFAYLSKRGQLDLVILVSHQPLVSRLLAALLNWNEQYFSFKTGSIAMVDVREMGSNPQGMLQCLLPPFAGRS
jgi:phosphohistidine phosphatase